MYQENISAFIVSNNVDCGFLACGTMLACRYPLTRPWSVTVYMTINDIGTVRILNLTLKHYTQNKSIKFYIFLLSFRTKFVMGITAKDTESNWDFLNNITAVVYLNLSLNAQLPSNILNLLHYQRRNSFQPFCFSQQLDLIPALFQVLLVPVLINLHRVLSLVSSITQWPHQDNTINQASFPLSSP